MKTTIKRLAWELKLPVSTVELVYNSYWKFIRNKIGLLPFDKVLTEEEFNKLRTSFNIPSLGKLGCTYKMYCSVKNQEKYVKYKEN